MGKETRKKTMEKVKETRVQEDSSDEGNVQLSLRSCCSDVCVSHEKLRWRNTLYHAEQAAGRTGLQVNILNLT